MLPSGGLSCAATSPPARQARRIPVAITPTVRRLMGRGSFRVSQAWTRCWSGDMRTIESSAVVCNCPVHAPVESSEQTDRGSGLASPRAVEDDPDSQGRAEILEAGLDAPGYEQDVAGLQGVAPARVEEDAAPAHDDVDLVLLVRRLLVRVQRKGEQEPDRAALEDVDEVLPGGSGDARAGIRQMNDATPNRMTHAVAPRDRFLPSRARSADRVIMAFGSPRRRS